MFNRQGMVIVILISVLVGALFLIPRPQALAQIESWQDTLSQRFDMVETFDQVQDWRGQLGGPSTGDVSSQVTCRVKSMVAKRSGNTILIGELCLHQTDLHGSPAAPPRTFGEARARAWPLIMGVYGDQAVLLSASDTHLRMGMKRSISSS